MTHEVPDADDVRLAHLADRRLRLPDGSVRALVRPRVRLAAGGGRRISTRSGRFLQCVGPAGGPRDASPAEQRVSPSGAARSRSTSSPTRSWSTPSPTVPAASRAERSSRRRRASGRRLRMTGARNAAQTTCAHVAPLSGATFRALGLPLADRAEGGAVRRGARRARRRPCVSASSAATRRSGCSIACGAVARTRSRERCRRLDRRTTSRRPHRSSTCCRRSRSAVFAVVSVVRRGPRDRLRRTDSDPEPDPSRSASPGSPIGVRPMHYLPHDHTHPHATTSPAGPGAFDERQAAARPRLSRARVHGRHRRPGRQRQDGAAPGALPAAARRLQPGGRDQRHLHEGGRRVPGAPRGARRRAHRRRSRPAAARTRRCATTSARTWTRSGS